MMRTSIIIKNERNERKRESGASEGERRALARQRERERMRIARKSSTNINKERRQGWLYTQIWINKVNLSDSTYHRL